MAFFDPLIYGGNRFTTVFECTPNRTFAQQLEELKPYFAGLTNEEKMHSAIWYGNALMRCEFNTGIFSSTLSGKSNNTMELEHYCFRIDTTTPHYCFSRITPSGMTGDYKDTAVFSGSLKLIIIE